MQLKLNKRYGQALVNLMRQISMTAVPCIRPIAFSVDNESNVLDTANSVVEDMTSFIHNVMSQDYYCNEPLSDAPIVCQNTVTNTLNTSSFASAGVLCKGDKDVLHALSSASVTVIFRYCSGNNSAKENVAYLKQHQIDTSKFTVVPSRHSVIDSFKIDEHESEDYYVADITIDSKISSESLIIDKTLEVLDLQVADLRKNLVKS